MKVFLRRIIYLLPVLVILILVACGTDESSTEEDSTKGDSTGEKSTEENSTEDEEYKLKYATVVNPPHAWVDMGEYFAEKVEEKTDGKVQISVNHSGTLGDDEEIMDEMQIGTIDFIAGGTQNAAPYMEQFQILGFSYLFENKEQFKEAMNPDGEIVARFNELYEEKDLDLKLLGLSDGGTRYLTHKSKDVTEADDLKGVDIRLPGSPIESKIWSKFGAVPTSMPWDEVYSGVQTGVADAFESTLSGYEGSKLYEVAPHIAKTEHLYMATHLTMSKLTREKLPDEYVEIIDEVAAETVEYGTQKAEEYDEKLLDELEEKGVTFSEVDKESFQEPLGPIYDELAEEINAEDLLEMIRDLQ